MEIRNSKMVMSYRSLRRLIGLIGILLPYVLVVGGTVFHKIEIQSSLSSYYHTGMRDIFVASLCSIGVFLIAYRGYDDAPDNVVSNIAGVSAILTALVPTSPENASAIEKMTGNWHLFFAAVLFCSLIYISYFLFTRTNAKNPTPEKLKRNKLYRLSALIMVGCIGVIVLYLFLNGSLTAEQRGNLDIVFWMESIMIIAFGISWLVKGEMFLCDK